jgi:hypothetical protein
LRQSLSMFAAHGVLIDNFTNLWLHEKSLDFFIPPYWAHVSLPLEGVNVAVLDWESPPGIAQPIAQPTTIAVAIYTDEDVQLNSGSLIPGTPTAPAAPWDFPNQLPLSIDGGMSNNSSITVLPPTPGVTYNIHRIRVAGVTVAPTNTPEIHFVTDPSAVFIGGLGATPSFSEDFDFHGAPLPIGVGLDILNTSGVFLTFGLTITYSKS